jgi:CheY-like chemotaxis protein
MRILVIENNTTEQSKAAEAIEAAGHEAIVTSKSSQALSLIGEADAVITDMFFAPARETLSETNYLWYRQNEPPMGLLMVILAMSQNKPVAVCTSSDHHGRELAFVYDGFVSQLYQQANKADFYEWMATGGPFGWIEGKDWGKAVEAVEAHMK